MCSSPGAQVAGSLICGMLNFTDTLEMGLGFLKKEKKILILSVYISKAQIIEKSI